MSESQVGITEKVQEGGKELAETVQEQASQAKEMGRSKLSEQLDERTTQIGTQARSFAGALRQTGQQMGPESDDTARLTSGMADRLERVGGYLERARGDEMLRDVERFARERPWLVAGAAAAAGLVASRFLKASSERRFEQTGGFHAQRGVQTASYADRLSTAETGRLETGVTRVGEPQYAGGVRA
jgi:ElaB/YqjD/DUF883 family membrane-anchored ribosome-binding protein